SAPGVGELRFERMAGRTVLTRVFATSPLKVLNPNTAGRAAWACLATYGGGLVSGDALQIGLETGPGAAALVTTQASTKVYRSEAGASQRLHARAAAESLLVLLPDPVTCF